MSATLLKMFRTPWRTSNPLKLHFLHRPIWRRNLSSMKSEGSSNTTTGEVKATPKPTIATSPSPALWQRLGPLSDIFSAYDKAQTKRPLTTNLAASLVIYCLGDFFAQQFGGEKYDGKRTLRALFIGGTVAVPAHKWFIYLGQSFNYSSKALSLAAKVIVNQIVFTPLLNTYFFGIQSLLSGASLSDSWDRIVRTVPPSVINSCKLWPAVTAFSFAYVNPHYRALFVGGVAIGWQCYLSWLNQVSVVETRTYRALVNSPQEGAVISP